jgi:hypothetical protein
METFTALKQFVENPGFHEQKQKILRELTDDMIDLPILGLIKGFNQLSCCFTLQCCYGHFVTNDQRDTRNFDPLPLLAIPGKLEYRIAYIAFCLEKSSSGIKLFRSLKAITAIDPQNIQFGCAEWFWNRQVNSYALQVEPARFMRQDTAILDQKEALHIEKIRNEFFGRLYALLENTPKK